MKKVSTYWICQLIGWGLYELANFFYIHNRLETFNANFVFLVLSILSGYLLSILVAHILYITIKRLNILSKKITVQALNIAALTLLFSFVKSFLWIVQFSWFFPIELIKKKSNLLSLYYMMGFYIASSLLIWNLIFFGYHFVQTMIKKEREKISREKQLWEVEARMLRNQVNPYFVFESTHFIRSFMRKKEKNLAIDYLTVFSKLIRILLQSGGKPLVSLYTELEACRHYVELKEMQMYNRLKSQFVVDAIIDQHSITIPSLSIQPFIEKAINYRIQPASEGTLSVTITRESDNIICDISDSGIDRKAYLLENKKGEIQKEINLTQRKEITNSKWFKENARVDVIDKIEDNGKLTGTIVRLTFKAYTDDQNSVN